MHRISIPTTIPWLRLCLQCTAQRNIPRNRYMYRAICCRDHCYVETIAARLAWERPIVGHCHGACEHVCSGFRHVSGNTHCMSVGWGVIWIIQGSPKRQRLSDCVRWRTPSVQKRHLVTLDQHLAPFRCLLADPRLRLHWFAENLFLLSRALHSALPINHAAQVWYRDGACTFLK